MGLLEKRAIKAFQEGSYLNLVKEINSIAGYELVFDVKWDSLAVDEYSHLYDEGFTKVYFTPIITALKEITVDDLGKDALKGALKKVVIKNENNIYYGDYAYSFDGGILTIDHSPNSNIDNISERSESLAKLLNKSL
jgi:hypothetical protein